MDIQTVEKVASLIRLELTDEQKQKYVKDLQGILEWVDCLNRVNTQGVEPLYNVNDADMPMRDDIVNDGGIADMVLQNAPEHMNNYFVVPKVVE